MPIEQCQITLRPRSAWEALDLGVAMGRRWRWELWWIWLTVSFLPVLIISILLRDWTLPFGLPDRNIQIPGVLFVIWWLKPLFERALLSVLQQALFNEPASTGRTLMKTVRSWLKWGVGDLTVWRLILARSFVLPIMQLEEGSYRATRSRIKLLRGYNGRIAGVLTLFFGCFEAILFIGIMTLGYLLLPGAWEQIVFDLLAEHPQSIFWSCIALYYAVLLLLEPFYVACGFALYLHSRTELDAWDVQLRFAQLAQREKASPAEPSKSSAMGRTVGIVLLGCLALGMTGVSLQDAQAESLASPQPSVGKMREVKVDSRCTAWKNKLENPAADSIKHNLQAILAAPEFDPCRTEGRWMKRLNRDDVRLPQWLSRWFQNLTQEIDRIDAERTVSQWSLPWLGQWIKWILLAAFGATALVVSIMLLYRQIKQRKRAPRRVIQADRLTAAWSAVPLPTMPLPTDPLSAARELCHINEMRAALSLLYRYAISELIEHFAVPVPPDATEAECLTLVTRRVNLDVADWYQELITIWQTAAYAHRLPTPVVVLSLCDRWSALIGGDHGS